MIFGKFEIGDNVIHTHNDTHILSNITTISARRPFLGSGLMIAALIAGFGVSFLDLLYPEELATITIGVGACLFVGLWLGKLQLLSRDLRGSELGTAVYGGYRHLNQKRMQVAEAVNQTPKGNENKGDVI